MEFSEWILPYQTDLTRYCFLLAGTKWDAEDLEQETLIKAYKYYSKVVVHPAPKAYLFKIASTVWIDFHRKKTIEIDEYTDISYDENYEKPFLLEEAMETLISILPPMQASIYLLIDVFGFTPKEVSILLENTEGGVKAALFRARRKLTRLTAKYKRKNKLITESKTMLIKEFINAFKTDNPLLIRDAYINLSLINIKTDRKILGRQISFEFTDIEGNILVIAV
ncbi:RNA polymerase sigma factor [Cytobacillus solani]|uniref:RNA polymerase sigma factor n=1 Tax=Cytobacillus solani TaxID=1637975 RepID=UPI0006ABB5D2|nr:RNA polymerase sigma factor [Cytobacillus solani]